MKSFDRNLLTNRTEKELYLTKLGFGGAPLGNFPNKIEENVAQETLDCAYHEGMRYFDTAPLYGYGISEMRYKKAIERFGRENLILSTKVGRLLEDCTPDEVTPSLFIDAPQKRIVYDYTYDGVMRSHEASLERLGVENVDILLVHDVDIFTHGSQEISDEKVRELFDGGGYRALSELKKDGRISAIGAGVNEWQVCEKLMGLGDFDCFLLAGRYTLLEQEALDSFLPLCEKNDVGIILGGPYNSGILATGPIEGARYNYDTAPDHIMERVRRIQEICTEHGVRLIEAALQFVFGHPAIKTVIPGAVRAEEVRSNVALLTAEIPAALWCDLKTAGLLRKDAPTPKES